MKIQGPSRPSPVQLREIGNAKRADAKSTRAGDSRERVNVSSQARVLSAAREPEVPDAGRIERLKEAIRSGTFAIDADRIASAMMREEV